MPTSTARTGSAEVPAPAPAEAAETSNPPWRHRGQAYRTSLLATDAEGGGSDFGRLDAAVPIPKYHQVGRRAYRQFRAGCARVDDRNADEIYLQGNRLLAFVAAVLPLHPQYGSSDHVELIDAREECTLMLADVGRLLAAVALYIDRRCHGDHSGHGHGHGQGQGHGTGGMERGEGSLEREDGSRGCDGESGSEEDGSELESIIEGNEEEEEEENDDDKEEAPQAPKASSASPWEADFSSAANTAAPVPSTPSPTKGNSTKSILQTPTATPSPSPRQKNHHRRVKFSPEVKPGRHLPPAPPLRMADRVEDDASVEEEYGDDDDDDDDDDERILSASLEEEEHRTFLRMTRMEFVDDADDAGDDAGDDADDAEGATPRGTGKEDEEGEDDDDDGGGGGDDGDATSIDDGAVLAAATEGLALSPPSRPSTMGGGDTNTIDRTNQALSDLAGVTRALSRRVRRYDAEEVDDVPTDEEHTDAEGESDDRAADRALGADVGGADTDEFAGAPGIHDLSRSSILYESEGSADDGGNRVGNDGIDDPEDLKLCRSNQGGAVEGGSSGQLSFMHQVAIQNFHSDFHRPMEDGVGDEDDEDRKSRKLDGSDSDAADSWAQDGGDGDGDDDFDTATTASETGDGPHDFGGDGFLRSELGFDGESLPTFPSDGRDPFLLHEEAPWPDQVEDFNPFDIDIKSSHGHAAEDGKANRARTESAASGTDADETAQTMPSSSNSYEYGVGDMPSIVSGIGLDLNQDASSVPDRLDYLESKLRALQQERLSEDHVVGDDEVEV